MRILIAHEAAAGAGGVESYLAALMPALVACGHELTFLHATSRTASAPTRLDRGSWRSVGVADDGIDHVMAQIREWRPDVCFSHNMGPLDVEARLVETVPVVKMMHGYFGTCISGQKSHMFPAAQPCDRHFGAPCLGLFLPRRCGQLRPGRMTSQFRWAMRQRAVLPRYRALIVASKHMAEEYRRHTSPEGRIFVAPMFATESEPAVPRALPASPSLLYIGRMTSLKGGDVLVRAAAVANRTLRTPLTLVMAGDGPEQERWQRIARECAVDARFPGWVTGRERTARLRDASVLAVPSLWPEPFGLVGLEAAVHGVPAVAFNVGGIGEWLHHGENGCFADRYGDAVSLGETVAAMLNDEPRLAALGVGARRLVRRFSMRAHLETIEPVLAEAAGRIGVMLS
ncbi:MAG: glycosyltransferase family 4 protein [Acidobacteria bacterium]|nr:glycosyltransferase family 4 protein [Acidobacteriota bacterium]MCA1649615.1 glycosyltransferase family 4 protein [Acidobacteriota bacterium]